MGKWVGYPLMLIKPLQINKLLSQAQYMIHSGFGVDFYCIKQKDIAIFLFYQDRNFGTAFDNSLCSFLL